MNVFPLLAAIWVAAAGAQVQDSRPATLPLAAVDSAGRPIVDLAAADVEVREAGRTRPVASVTFRGSTRRHLAVFLDDYHVSPGAPTERAKEFARGLVGAYARPDDALYVLRPLDPQQSIAPVETRQQALGRIETFAGRKGAFAPAGPFEAEYMSTAPAAVARERGQIVRAALQSLATALRDPLDAPKALVIISEGFSGDERPRARLTTMRVIARVARLGNVPVYVIDPADEESAMPGRDAWLSLAAETGGAVLHTAQRPEAALRRIGSELAARHIVQFVPAAAHDGGFHPVEVRVRRPGSSVRAPSGYWAPFAASRFGAITAERSSRALLTPHVSGLIQPWFRMAPGPDGRTRVTFFWTPRTAARRAETVSVAAITFEGARLHEASVSATGGVDPAGTRATSFEVAPGPLQISMAIASVSRAVLATDVRYIDVPRFDAVRPVIAGVELVRPRSFPELQSMRDDPAAPPTELRDFVRQDRLLVRVYAYAGGSRPDVHVRLLNRRGDVLMELTRTGSLPDAAQFELPFARFPRGEYRLEVRAAVPGEDVSQLLPVRLLG